MIYDCFNFDEPVFPKMALKIEVFFIFTFFFVLKNVKSF